MLNSRLSEYIRLAASGETVLVTDRDRVVAEIGPPRPTRSPILASCDYLLRQGQSVALASYDRRMNAIADTMNIPLLDLDQA